MFTNLGAREEIAGAVAAATAASNERDAAFPGHAPRLGKKAQLIFQHLDLNHGRYVRARELALVSFGVFDARPTRESLDAEIDNIDKICAAGMGYDPVRRDPKAGYMLVAKVAT
jgi:hypothetical protein